MALAKHVEFVGEIRNALAVGIMSKSIRTSDTRRTSTDCLTTRVLYGCAATVESLTDNQACEYEPFIYIYIYIYIYIM